MTLNDKLAAGLKCSKCEGPLVKSKHGFTGEVHCPKCSPNIEPVSPLAAVMALPELIAWLRNESEELMGQVLAREESAKHLHEGTQEDWEAGRKIAQQMAGRKLSKTSVENRRRSAEIEEIIAKKLEKESRQLSAWADALAVLPELEKLLAEARREALQEAAQLMEEEHSSGCTESRCVDGCPSKDPAAAIRGLADLRRAAGKEESA